MEVVCFTQKGDVSMEQELVTLFIRTLDNDFTESSAINALNVVNQAFTERLRTETPDSLEDELIALWDAAVDFDLLWPSPIGGCTKMALINTDRLRQAEELQIEGEGSYLQ